MKYPISERSKSQIENTFRYHSPKSDQPERYNAIRSKAHELAILIAGNTPASREQSLALTNLEEAVMFANAAFQDGDVEKVFVLCHDDALRVRNAKKAPTEAQGEMD